MRPAARPSALGPRTAVVLATAPADGGGPAAGLAIAGATVIGRLAEQLAGLGVRSAHVITRPPWEAEMQAALAGAPLRSRVRMSQGLTDDLCAVAELARTTRGGLVVLAGDAVTHREALAGLLADPRLDTAVLGSRAKPSQALGVPARTARGRLVSAASSFHEVHEPNLDALAILKVAPEHGPELADGAMALASLSSRQPFAGRDTAGDPDGQPPSSQAPGADAAALLLVALVRRGVGVKAGDLRGYLWNRVRSPADVRSAEAALAGVDERRILLDSAVKANDGFFTTFFVSPYSKYLARWAADRRWTPNQVTTLSLAIGVVAAVCFATGERAGLVAGAALVHVSFVFDCVDGQLARYTRTFSKLGAWLDSVFDRAKEYVVFAGLAIGASLAGDDVWILAGAALALQSVRHLLDFSFGATRRRLIDEVVHPPLDQAADAETLRARALGAGQPGGEDLPPAPSGGLLHRGLALWRTFDPVPGVLWAKKIMYFPIGERFAAIALTAALSGPRLTFTVLLAWGGFAACYAITGRIVRSLAA